MRKSIIVRIGVTLCLILGLCVGLVPAKTALAEEPHAPYRGIRFSGVHICVYQHEEAKEWPVATADNYLDSVTKFDTVVRTDAQGGCGSYSPSQILHVRDANLGSSGACIKLVGTGTSYPASEHPWNTTYNYVYGYAGTTFSSPTVYLNNTNSKCFSTSTRRANTTSQGMAAMLGLAQFGTSEGYASVMNDSDSSRASVPWATGYDRNGLYYLYE